MITEPSVFSAANYCGIYENDGALLEIDRHLTVLPKVLKARPIAPLPMTEVPEEDEEDEEEAAGAARAAEMAAGRAPAVRRAVKVFIFGLLWEAREP